MKKSTILIIFVLAAMILGVVASASAVSTSKCYADGANAIDKIRVALDKGNKSGAEEGLAQLRNALGKLPFYFIQVSFEIPHRSFPVGPHKGFSP